MKPHKNYKDQQLTASAVTSWKRIKNVARCQFGCQELGVHLLLCMCRRILVSVQSWKKGSFYVRVIKVISPVLTSVWALSPFSSSLLHSTLAHWPSTHSHQQLSGCSSGIPADYSQHNSELCTSMKLPCLPWRERERERETPHPLCQVRQKAVGNECGNMDLGSEGEKERKGRRRAAWEQEERSFNSAAEPSVFSHTSPSRLSSFAFPPSEDFCRGSLWLQMEPCN